MKLIVFISATQLQTSVGQKNTMLIFADSTSFSPLLCESGIAASENKKNDTCSQSKTDSACHCITAVDVARSDKNRICVRELVANIFFIIPNDFLS